MTFAVKKKNFNLKACLKKSEAEAKKQAAKKKKTQEETKQKAHVNDIKRLVFNNVRPQVKIFKAILSDPAILSSSHPLDVSSFPSFINQIAATKACINSMRAISKQQKFQKQATSGQ